MKLEPVIRNAITSIFGIAKEKIDNLAPLQITDLIMKADIHWVDADQSIRHDLYVDMQKDGITACLCDNSNVEHPKGYHITATVRIEEEGKERLDVPVPNPAEEYGTEQRFYFKNEKDAVGEAYRIATCLYLCPASVNVKSLRYEALTNRERVREDERKQRIIKELCEDILGEPGLFPGLHVVGTAPNGHVAVFMDTGNGNQINLEDLTVDSLLGVIESNFKFNKSEN